MIFSILPFWSERLGSQRRVYSLLAHPFRCHQPWQTLTIICQDDREELEEIFVRLVKSVLDVIEVFGNLKGSFIIQKSSEDKVTERQVEGEWTLPPILPITVSISSQEFSCLRAK